MIEQPAEPTKLDNAVVVLDARISSTFFRLLLVDGMILALLGLAMVEPVPLYFGFGFLVLGLFSVAVCLYHITKIGNFIKSLSRPNGK